MIGIQSTASSDNGIFSFTDNGIISFTLPRVHRPLLIMGTPLYQAGKSKQVLNAEQGSACCNDHKQVLWY